MVSLAFHIEPAHGRTSLVLPSDHQFNSNRTVPLDVQSFPRRKCHDARLIFRCLTSLTVAGLKRVHARSAPSFSPFGGVPRAPSRFEFEDDGPLERLS